MTLSQYLSAELLDHSFAVGVAFPQPTVLAMGFSSTRPNVTNDSNVTEPSGGGYARVDTAGSWNAVGGDRNTTNSATIAFAASTGAWLGGARLRFNVLYDALAGGNLLRYGETGKEADQYFQAADVNTTNNRITLTAHGYSNSDQAVVRQPAGSILATGLADDSLYYIGVVDANTLELYTDVGLSSQVNLTAQGTGTQRIYKVDAPIIDAAGRTLSFGVGQVSISATIDN